MEQYSQDNIQVAIICGGGFSGLCMAKSLKDYKLPFLIIEKSSAFGGTWFDNTYPGCGCDVPSFMYSFSFFPNYSWSRKWAQQHEILQYINSFVSHFDLHPHIKLNTTVHSARWDAQEGLWRVQVQQRDSPQPQELRARFFISAVGQLNEPQWPDLPGKETFTGHQFHSARWDHSFQPADRRLAVIGNAASAIQLIPPLAKLVKQLYVFQRTPSYVVPKADYEYPAWALFAFKYVPFAALLHRWALYFSLEMFFMALNKSEMVQKRTKDIGQNLIRENVKNPELLEKVLPNYPLGCKRTLLSSEYYPTLHQPNVELIDANGENNIVGLCKEGLRLKSGRLVEVDAIVYATGFQSVRFLQGFEVYGVNGLRLRKRWGEEEEDSQENRNDQCNWSAEAYLGLSVSDFPNFFIIYGPNTNLGHNSILFMIECQVNYIMQCIEEVHKRPGCKGLDVIPEAERTYEKLVEDEINKTVFVDSCASWYKNAQGKVINNCPFTTIRYWWMCRHPNFSHFKFV